MADLQLQFDPAAARCITCDGAIRPWGDKPAHGHRFHYDRCDRCGFVFVNPRPTAASLGDFYEGYAQLTGMPVAPALSPRAPVAGPPQHALITQMVAARGAARGATAEPAGRERFLDVGSGSGVATAAAHDAGLAVTALEVDAGAVAATRQLPRVEVLPLLFEQYDPAADHRFDYILMSHVLEHVHDPRRSVEKAARLLAPGGLLCVLLPSFDSIYRHLLGTRDPYFIPPGHLNHFNPANLAALCRRVGLRVVESVDYHDVPRNVVSKRLPRRLSSLAGATEAATAVGASLANWGTRVSGTGAFVRCFAVKPAAA